MVSTQLQRKPSWYLNIGTNPVKNNSILDWTCMQRSANIPSEVWTGPAAKMGEPKAILLAYLAHPMLMHDQHFYKSPTIEVYGHCSFWGCLVDFFCNTGL